MIVYPGLEPYPFSSAIDVVPLAAMGEILRL